MDTEWETQFNQLIDFIKENGKPPSRTKNNELILSRFMETCKASIDKETPINEERKNKMLETDYFSKWYKNKDKDGEWKEKLEKVKYYFESKNGKAPSAVSGTDDEKAMGNWIKDMKKQFNKLSDERKELLLEIPYMLKWYNDKYGNINNEDEEWINDFNKLKIFIDENNRKPRDNKIGEEKELFNFLRKSKRNIKKGDTINLQREKILKDNKII